VSSTLITGSMGFIGRRTVTRLVSRGEHPYLLVRNSQLDQAHELFGSVARIISEAEFFYGFNFSEIQTVVNLAGFYTYGSDLVDIEKLIESNIRYPSTILAALAENTPQLKWIQASTFMSHYNGSQFDPTCFYASTKQAMTDILAYYESLGLTIHDLVLPQIFGENDDRPKLLNLLIEAVRTREQLVLSSGNQIMDLVYAEDVVDAIVLIREQDASSKTQLTSGINLTIKMLIKMIEKASGNTVDVLYDSTKNRIKDPYDRCIAYPKPKGWDAKVSVDSWLSSMFNVSS